MGATMIDKNLAREIAAKHIEEGCATPDGVTPVIVDDQTIETEFGWIFFYQSREYLLTDDFSFCLVGNAPIIVDREDGSLHETGTAEPLEHYIENYRRSRKGR